MCHGVRLGEMCMIVEQCYLAECQHQVARDPSHKLLSTSRNYKGQGCSLRQTNQGSALSLPPQTSKLHTYREDNYHRDITTVCGGEVRNIGSCPNNFKTAAVVLHRTTYINDTGVGQYKNLMQTRKAKNNLLKKMQGESHIYMYILYEFSSVLPFSF